MIFRWCAFSYDWRRFFFVHYVTHTDRMQMVSLRIDRNCIASHLHAISCGETIRSEIILLTRGMHTQSPLPDADRWSLLSLHTNPGSALDIIVMQIFPCCSLFSFHPDITCLIYSIILPASRHSTGETIRSERRNKRKSQLKEWLGWKTRSTSSAEDPTECTSSRIRNHSMNWKKKTLK